MVPIYVAVFWFFAGMMFGHSQTKYARRKQVSAVIGIVFLLAGIVLTIYSKEEPS